jgi:hypothetical protein
MARISVVGTPFDKVLLQDLDKKQSLREHTINPPGQERYIHPVDVEALDALLDSLGVTEDAAAVIAGTVDAGDISLANIDTVTTEGLTADEQQDVQDLLSYSFVETGHFLLSFDGGVLKGLVDKGWIKVFTDAGDALFTL